MAYSTSASTFNGNDLFADVELPRYRHHKSNTDSDNPNTEVDPFLTPSISHDDTFDSRFTDDLDDTEHTKLLRSGSVNQTSSSSERPVVRKLVFRRHWIYTDITVYSAHPASSTVNSESSSLNTNANNATDKETPVYHLATSTFSLYSPDITMYTGPAPSPAHVLATSYFRWSRNALMTFGRDALEHFTGGASSEAATVVSAELKNTSNYLLHSTYELTLPSKHLHPTASPLSSLLTPKPSSNILETTTANESSSTNNPLTTHRFRLQRTHPSDTILSLLSLRNYTVTDLSSNLTIGVFVADNLRSLTRIGELRLYRALSKEEEVAAVLALGSISEKAGRRERYGKCWGGGF